MDFRCCWTWPEVAILGADQKKRGLWGQECASMLLNEHGHPFFISKYCSCYMINIQWAKFEQKSVVTFISEELIIIIIIIIIITLNKRYLEANSKSFVFFIAAVLKYLQREEERRKKICCYIGHCPQRQDRSLLLQNLNLTMFTPCQKALVCNVNLIA